MLARAPRFLLAFSSLLMAVGCVIHAVAFPRVLPVVGASRLPPFFGNSLKSLWLGDSATMLVLAVIFGVIAARPAVATKPIVLLIALIPAATAVLLYVFLGNFFAGHIHLATATGAVLAGFRFPGVRN